MEEKDPMMEMVAKIMVAVVAVMFMAPYIQQMFSRMAAAQTLQTQSYIGLTDEKTLEANRFLQWANLIGDPPYVSWISASFHNDGPQSVFIAINNPDEMLEVANGEDYGLDMAGAARRIEFIFYRCNIGETASVRVIGKY